LLSYRIHAKKDSSKKLSKSPPSCHFSLLIIVKIKAAIPAICLESNGKKELWESHFRVVADGNKESCQPKLRSRGFY